MQCQIGSKSLAQTSVCNVSQPKNVAKQSLGYGYDLIPFLNKS